MTHTLPLHRGVTWDCSCVVVPPVQDGEGDKGRRLGWSGRSSAAVGYGHAKQVSETNTSTALQIS